MTIDTSRDILAKTAKCKTRDAHLPILIEKKQKHFTPYCYQKSFCSYFIIYSVIIFLLFCLDILRIWIFLHLSYVPIFMR